MGEQTFNISDENLEQHIVTLFEKLECLRKDANSHSDGGLSGRVPARMELRTLSLWKAVVAECAASFLYVFIVCGAAGGAGVGASASAVLLSTALASGCAIATLTMCFANISGAHVNPTVSAALCVRRRVSPLRAALYVAAQCGGAIAGAAAIYGNHGVSPLHQLLLALRFYALGTMLVSVADYVGVSIPTASRIVRNVSRAIAGLYDKYVTVRPNTQPGFHAIAGFPRVLGALDCTHILIQSPSANVGEQFRNRKGTFSLNVQGVCDAELILMNVVARWPGSAHDATIFNNSDLKVQCEDGVFGNRWLIADSAYPCNSYLLTPVLSPSTPNEHRYNDAHVLTRNPIESVSVPGYAGGLSASLPGGGAAAWERLGAELVLSALVAAAHFAAMERRWTGAAPALLGAAYCAASFVSMPSLNPARSLGPSFVLSRWESHWVCWVGGVGGGVASALLHEWGSKRGPRGSSRASSPRDLDELDKPAFPTHTHYRHAPTYCAAAAPRPDTTEPLYSGTKSLYCRSPPPARHGLHRSQSVYSKGSSATSAGGAGGTSSIATASTGPLIGAQSLVLRPPHSHAHHTLTHNQNAQNAQRDPPYGTANGVRPGPAGAASATRRESLYSGSGREAAAGGAAGPRRGADDVAGAVGAAAGATFGACGVYGRSLYRAPHTPPHAHDHY